MATNIDKALYSLIPGMDDQSMVHSLMVWSVETLIMMDGLMSLMQVQVITEFKHHLHF